MIPALVSIGGRGGVSIYMHKGYDQPQLSIDEYVDIAERDGVGDKLTLIAGTPSNPTYAWPVYAARILSTW